MSARPTRATGRDCGPVRPSRRGRWRALSLILVHVAAAIHIAHWWSQGRTLTPVEPSEAAETLTDGVVNAGFVLFALLILGTLVLGRFFCGWGCHIVALQDLCTWILRRLGIRPRPFRSRLLVWVPLGSALYIFVLPPLVRAFLGQPRPALQAHFLTDDFWGRFPGWPVALLTFAVCGFLIVYLLGNKGFCTYGCPYGGVFGLADLVAPGKIRVTDACSGCAHCTATCTSNVRVHEEVRTWGMVVDPGCMKCMDCVNVCPKGALYYGFGAPTVARGVPRKARKPRAWDYGWPEEIGLAVAFLVSIVVLARLYEAVPLLLALGLSAISAWVLVTLGRFAYRRELRAGRFCLRAAGRTTRAGWVFACAALVWVAFLAHSGWIRTLNLVGGLHLDRAFVASGAGESVAAESRDELLAAVRALERCRGLGLVPVPNLLARLGTAYRMLGDHTLAEERFRQAAAVAPRFALAHYELGRYAIARGADEEAVTRLRTAVERRPDLPGAVDALVPLLFRLERSAEAVALLEGLVRRRPEDPGLRLTLGLARAESGDHPAARSEVGRVLEDRPRSSDAHFAMARILTHEGRSAEALAACARSVEIDGSRSERSFFCAKLCVRLGDWDGAVVHLDRARRIRPDDEELFRAWAVALDRSGRLPERIDALELLAPVDPARRRDLEELRRAEQVAGELAPRR